MDRYNYDPRWNGILDGIWNFHWSCLQFGILLIVKYVTSHRKSIQVRLSFLFLHLKRVATIVWEFIVETLLRNLRLRLFAPFESNFGLLCLLSFVEMSRLKKLIVRSIYRVTIWRRLKCSKCSWDRQDNRWFFGNCCFSWEFCLCLLQLEVHFLFQLKRRLQV